MSHEKFQSDFLKGIQSNFCCLLGDDSMTESFISH